MTQRPYHVLITRLSAIGDCVLTLPLATAIKQQMPNAIVSWAVSCAADQLIQRCPDVDHVIKLSKRWFREPQQWKKLHHFFRNHPIDAVLDPQSLTKSALIGRLSNAPVRIGFAKPLGRELAPWLNTISLPATEGHLVDRQLQLLTRLGIQTDLATFRLDLSEVEKNWAHQQQKQRGLDSMVVMNPGAGWDSRLWPRKRFAEVAAWLRQEYSLETMVVWSGDRERTFAQEIVAGSGGAAMLAPPTNLLQLAALLQRANLFISSDTGPMHIAAAVGTRCISLHGPTQPQLSGPYGQHHVRIRKVSFDASSRVRRTAGNWSMKAIQTSDVCRAVSEVMASTSGVQAAA